jgi:ABC-2 type transport system ATP-binding protein
MQAGREIIVELVELRKSFGSLTAVDSLSFGIHKGEIFGFLGPNGAGKTTTISMICGLLPPTSGNIIFSGRKINNYEEIKSRIGFCPQENIHYNKLTCSEQLIFIAEMYGLPRRKAKERSVGLLDKLGLAEKSDVFAGKLSGGMKRRLNICLALVHDPELIILDEPEAGLDPQSRILVRNFIKSMAQEKTVILTTHNMDEADRMSDRVAIVDHGRLLMIDSPENLKKSIGEGDILEIEFDRPPENDGKLKELFCSQCREMNFDGSVLTIRSNDLIGRIPEITGNINRLGYSIHKMTIRENTLEDVFISLTGNKLRQ